MRYKAILMDADQTILDFNAAEKHAIEKLSVRYGITAPEAYDRYHQININCWAAYERGELTLESLKYLRFERFLQLYLPGADVRRIGDEYESLLAGQNDLIPHAGEALAAIAARLPVAIVTNGTRDIQRARIAASPIGRHIAQLVISEEVGFGKPDPRIIFLAMEKLGVSDPADVLMIGDSLTSDMAAARGAGVDFLWYNPAGIACPPGAHVTYEARDVRDFVPIALMEEES